LLIAAYGVYAWLSVRRGGEEADEEDLRPLYFDPSRDDPPHAVAILVQVLVGIGAIVGGAHLFVEELLALAESLGVSALVLSLLLAPLATELPEKANSLLWVRQGKDSLALGNITGAMVFQSAIPVALGLVLTQWALDTVSVLAVALALAGGAVAYFVLSVRRRFTAPALASWAALFAAFVVYVVVVA
jgi:cation:H+ antiporter